MRIVAFLACLITLPTLAKDPCVSGPQLGQRPGPYSFLVASGPQRGQPTCYVCETDTKPGIIVFSRSTSANLAKLLTVIDQAVSDRPKGDLTAWMTVLGEKTITIDALGQWAKEQGFKTLPTGVFDDPVGPPSYKLATDADVTVLLFNNRKVTHNFAFYANELDDAAIKKITEAVNKHGKK